MNTHLPAVVCFPGSGENPLPSWDQFVELAKTKYTVILHDRGQDRISLEDANTLLLKHLKSLNLEPPYVLIAHSYGGAFAKMLLHQRPALVAGMVLAETGQEGGLPGNVETLLLSKTPMGNKPLSVIRCNSLIARWKDLETAKQVSDGRGLTTELLEREDFLRKCDHEDERLKKAQLKLSKVARYVHLPDCGHHTIRDQPDVVLQELNWIMENLKPEQPPTSSWLRLKSLAVSWLR